VIGLVRDIIIIYRCDTGFTSNQTAEPLNGRMSVKHAFIEVQIEDLRTVFDLLFGHSNRFLEKTKKSVKAKSKDESDSRYLIFVCLDEVGKSP